jgi:DNA-binding XRE family transcriptional regulator
MSKRRTALSFESWKRKQLRNPAVKAEYDRLGPQFELAAELIGARAKAGLTQAQVARRMRTSQSAVARMESGDRLPSTSSLLKYARAVGRDLKIALS